MTPVVLLFHWTPAMPKLSILMQRLTIQEPYKEKADFKQVQLQYENQCQIPFQQCVAEWSDKKDLSDKQG